MNNSEDLMHYLARRFQETSKLRQLEECLESMYIFLQEKGYNYTDIKQAELNIIKRKTKIDHPEYRLTWTEIVPLQEQILRVSEAEGRELP